MNALDLVWIVGFSGHRPDDRPGRTERELRECREALRTALEGLQEHARAQGGTIELLTGAAAGSDLHAAEAAAELGIPVHVLMPMPVSMFEQSFTKESESDWPRAKRVIESAQQGEFGGTIRIASGDNTPPSCYHEANIQLIERSDFLLAVFDGEPAEGIGGTEEAIEQARGMEIPLILVDPKHPTVVDLSDAKSSWPECDQETRALLEYDGVAGQEVSRDVFDRLDGRATRLADRFRGRLLIAVYLHFVASLLAATSAAFLPMFHSTGHGAAASHAQRAIETTAVLTSLEEGPDDGSAAKGHHASSWLGHVPRVLTGGELVLVVVALLLMVQVHVGHYHGAWRRTRFAAEIARGLRGTARLLDPLDPLVLRHSPGWRRFALALALSAYRESDPDATLEDRRARYLRDRVEDQRDRYFRKQHSKSRTWAQWLRRIGSFSAVSAPVFIGIAFYLKLFREDSIESSWLEMSLASWFPVVLPLMAGFATALLVAGDYARRAERYRVMYDRLERSSKILERLKTEGAVARAVAETEEILLDELVEWDAAAKNSQH